MHFFFKLIFIYLFIFGCTGSLLLLYFSLVAANRGYSNCVCRLIVVAFLVMEHGLYNMWASVAVAKGQVPGL